MGFLDSLFGGDTGKASVRAADRNERYVGQFRDRGLNALGEAEDKSAGFLGQAGELYDPIIARSRLGADLYGDAMGLGGADGVDRAQGAFQTGPGYQFAMDQGLEALNRGASARGMLGSGNTSADTLG